MESGLILRFSILPENGQFDWYPLINFIVFAQNGRSFHSHYKKKSFPDGPTDRMREEVQFQRHFPLAGVDFLSNF